MVESSEKRYFKIGEVARLTGVKAHVLRYWETEFQSIRPVKSRSKQRLYQKKDIEQVLTIKDLLYSQGFTIPGARTRLREMASEGKGGPCGEELSPARALLAEIREDLLGLRETLAAPPEGGANPPSG